MKSTRYIIVYEQWDELFGWSWKVLVYTESEKEEMLENYADICQQAYTRNYFRIKRTMDWKD